MMKKIEYVKDFTLRHEGQTWHINFSVWRDDKNSKGEFRVHRVAGNVVTPLLHEALMLEAATRGLALLIGIELPSKKGNLK